MPVNAFGRSLVVAGFALVAASPALFAQPAEQPAEQPPPPAPSAPARPMVIPMTPGASTAQQKPKPSAAKPKIVRAPAAGDAGESSLDVAAPGGAGADAKAGTPAVDRSEMLARKATTDYTFCNKTSYATSIAVGIRNGGLWLTRGWWTVIAGECKVVIKGTLTQPTYYIFARSSFAHSGAVRTWGGTQTLCIGNGAFQATSDGSDECSAAYEPQGFARVDTEGKSAWTTMLSESPAIKSMDQARVAGLQRLLYDLGRFEGPIDGVANAKFTAALTAARTELAAPAGDSAGLYTKLLAEATKAQATAGLTFCNRTQDVIWTALGQDYQSKKESKGWWRLQPGQCAKVIKDRLEDRTMFGFGIADRLEGAAETWGGTEQFCTRDSSFEIEDTKDCSGRGFASTGFMKIETAGRPGLTFEFAPRHADAQQ